MRNFLTIWRREFLASFLSPVAYVTLIIFLAVSGGTFIVGIHKYDGSTESIPAILFAAVVTWATVLITVVSMRLFAEEKRTKSIEMLMTAPVTETEVVLGKYAGAMSFLVLALLPAVCNVFIVAHMSRGITLATVDPGSILAGCIILFMVTALCTAIGTLVSMLTENQIVAALCCFCAIWFVLAVGSFIPSLPGTVSIVADYLSVFEHIEDFARGAVDTRPVFFYLSLTVFTLFASVRFLESRRWK